MVIIVLLGVVLTAFAGTRVDRFTGRTINNFLNADTLLQIATDTSFFAIMAVGMTMVIVSGGIDLSVGSIYAMCGVLTAIALKAMGLTGGSAVFVGLLVCAGIGVVAGLANGVMVSKLNVHPFIITLGTMWVYRGIAFVTTKAESMIVVSSITEAIKSTLGLRKGLFPIPLLATLLVALIGTVFLARTVWGRRIYAIGGNPEAARFSGIPNGRVLTGVYVISGLVAGLAAFLASGFYGSASSGDAQGYELYVIASAVVGGASLSGGRGTALGAVLGALLITMIRQAIRTLRLDQNYEWIIIGVAIVLAVVVDRLTQASVQRRLASANLGQVRG